MPRDGSDSDFRRVLYGMAAAGEMQSLNIEGVCAEVLRQERSRISCVAGAGGSVCDSSVRERVGLLCSCTLIFEATGELCYWTGRCVGM
jgi:hypothetical protein